MGCSTSAVEIWGPVDTATSPLIALDPEAFIQKALRLLSSERYFEKGMGLMALTGREWAMFLGQAIYVLGPLSPIDAYSPVQFEISIESMSSRSTF
jgi:hypothetical protein